MYQLNTSVFIAAEQSLGLLKVVLPRDNQLQIDIDSDEAYGKFLEMLDMANRSGVRTRVLTAPSKSGLPHRHITIDLDFDVSPWSRIALQAALGSDMKREFLSAMRLITGDAPATAFLELNEENGDESWLNP